MQAMIEEHRLSNRVKRITLLADTFTDERLLNAISDVLRSKQGTIRVLSVHDEPICSWSAVNDA